MRDVPKEEWDALAGDAPFASHTWLDCLEEAGCVGGRTGWTPMHLVLRSKGSLVAVAPMYLKTNSEGEFVYDWSFAELARRLRAHYYPKIVCAVPFTPAQGPRVLARDRSLVEVIARALPDIAKELDAYGAHVLFPLDDEARLWERAGYVRRAGVQFHWHNRGYRDVSDFLSGFTSKKRNQIKREMAQPAKDGIEIRTLSPKELAPPIVEAMFRFYLSTVDKFVWGRRYLNRRFFDLVVQRMPEKLAWVMAFEEGRPIAGAFNVTNGKTLWGRYWGVVTPDGRDRQFLHFNVCYYHGIVDCIARGIQTFEPGAGGEHKKARGFDPTMTHSAHWIRDARLREVLEPALERERDAIKEWIETGDEP